MQILPGLLALMSVLALSLVAIYGASPMPRDIVRQRQLLWAELAGLLCAASLAWAAV